MSIHKRDGKWVVRWRDHYHSNKHRARTFAHKKDAVDFERLIRDQYERDRAQGAIVGEPEQRIRELLSWANHLVGELETALNQGGDPKVLVEGFLAEFPQHAILDVTSPGWREQMEGWGHPIDPERP